MTDNVNGAAEKNAPIAAQQLTDTAQASSVITASTQVEQMEVGLRSKRANEQPQDATIQSSPTSAKNAPPLRAPGSEKSKASKSLQGLLSVQPGSEPDDEVPLKDRYRMQGRSRKQSYGREPSPVQRPGRGRAPARSNSLGQSGSATLSKGVRL